VCPEKPKTGIRATQPNERWHIDGTISYVRGERLDIDDFSRRILSSRLARRLENVNARVDQLMADGVVRRVLAQVEVSFSNSMIEAFSRSLRHQWLWAIAKFRGTRRYVA